MFGVRWNTLDAFGDAVDDSFAVAPEVKGSDAVLEHVERGAKLSAVAGDDVALEGGPDVSGVVVGVVDPPSSVRKHVRRGANDTAIGEDRDVVHALDVLVDKVGGVIRDDAVIGGEVGTHGVGNGVPLVFGEGDGVIGANARVHESTVGEDVRKVVVSPSS